MHFLSYISSSFKESCTWGQRWGANCTCPRWTTFCISRISVSPWSFSLCLDSTCYLCRILWSGDPGQLQLKHKQSGRTLAKRSPSSSCLKVAKLVLTCGMGWVQIGQNENWEVFAFDEGEKMCRLPSHGGELRKALQHQCLIYNRSTSFLEPARHSILTPYLDSSLADWPTFRTWGYWIYSFSQNLPWLVWIYMSFAIYWFLKQEVEKTGSGGS